MTAIRHQSFLMYRNASKINKRYNYQLSWNTNKITVKRNVVLIYFLEQTLIIIYFISPSQSKNPFKNDNLCRIDFNRSDPIL